MKNISVIIMTAVISSLATTTFALGNVETQGGGYGPAKVGIVGTAPGKALRASKGKTIPQALEKKKEAADEMMSRHN